ncbi:hypothetical protein [Streptomyces sp. TLI_185]|uniref:hypothetical protein n=1 Tax=Streptomyces sp. TLI_185 TaxID=2485151 RepID=UPI000FB39472|nr:hypothetical protein [Streptomyces sp. TLI_185]RPF39027.1 hypothetical protein EDD92_9209 [Streptomyces sp. TLI_185]
MTTQPNFVVVTGASNGLGHLTAQALAEVGHTVRAGMRASTGRDSYAVAALTEVKTERGCG